MRVKLEKIERRLMNGAFLNLIGFLFYGLIVYLACLLVAYFAFWEKGWWIALSATVVFFVAGLITHLRGKYDQWIRFETPFEVTTIGSFVVNREIAHFSGPAYVVGELIMGSSRSFLDFITKIKLHRVLSQMKQSEVNQFIATLQSQARVHESRYCPITEFTHYYHLIPALASEEVDVLWFKHERGSVKIGLNREYD